MKNSLPLLFLLFSLSLFGQGGGCGCTNCPQFMPDNFQGDFLINVVGATNNDLSDPNQGVCEVRLNFDHQYIGDLSIVLISPSGQQVVLVGPIGLFGETDLSTWEVSFIPCAATPMTDGGPGVWNNANVTLQNFDFTGSYHPVGGCLEDFDSGTVNGTWTLLVTDGQAIDVGTFIDYEIIFCDDDGINCNSNACGVFAEAEAPSFACQGDTVVIDASGSTGNTFEWGTVDGTFAGTPSGPMVAITTSGTYMVTVSDNGSCPEVATIIFNTVPEVPSADITLSGVLDCDNTEITLQGETDQVDDVFVVWINGTDVDPENFDPLGMDLDLEVDEPGVYTLVVINTESACSQTATVIVEDESEIPIISAIVADTISCTQDTIGLVGVSDTDDSIFEWTGPDGFTSSNENPDIVAGGIYNLTVTAPNGCIDSVMLTVESDTIPPDITISSTNDIDCTITSSTLSINSTETLGAVSWTGPNGFSSDEETPEITQGGTYTLVASAENGCTTESTIDIMQTADIPDISVVDDGLISCSTTFFELSGNSTTPDATFSWTGPNGFSSDVAVPGMVSDTGTYVLTVTAPNGCSTMNEVFITADTLMPELTLGTPGILGCDNMTTILTNTTSETGLTYEWSGPNGQSFSIAEPTVEGPGTYELIITGENGCQNTFTVDVTLDDTEPVINISVAPDDILTCNETEFSLINTSDPNNDFSWSGPNGFSSTDLEPLVSEAGTYTLIATGPNGCTSMEMVQVEVDTISPDIDFITAELTCTETVVAIGVTSTSNIVEYSWSGPSAYTSIEQIPSDITEGGSYTAVITAENGCTNTISFEVAASMEMPDGEITTVSGTQLDCNLTELTLTADGLTTGSTLSWMNPAGDIISTDNEIDANTEGTYSLIITGPNGCERTVETLIEEDINGPLITANPDVDLLCLGAVPLVISSDENITSYLWTGPNGFSSEEAIPNTDAEGTYSLVVTGENGCTSSSSVDVINRQEMPSIFVDPSQTLVCGVDQITISGGSNETNVAYNWTTPNGSILGDINNASINLNAQGNYFLTITNLDNGCEASAEVIVDQDNNIPDASIITEQVNVLDCNVSEIVLNASDSDNGAGFSFVWGNTGGTDVSAETNLQTTVTEAGTYFITVTNEANQCTSIASVTIESDMEAPLLQLSQLEELNCNVTSFSIENIGLNASNNLLYDWQTVNGGNITSASDLSLIEVDMPGTYLVTLTNPENGCSSEFPFEVFQNIEEPEVSAGLDATLVCGVSSLSLNGSLNSNETDIDIIWTTDSGQIISGEDTFTPEVNASGTYTLTIINNENGCEASAEVMVEKDNNIPDAFIIAEQANVLNCNISEITLNANNSDNGAGFSFVWGNTGGTDITGESNLQTTVTEAGSYFITITNTANQCTSIASLMIENDMEAPILELSQLEVLNCNLTSLSIENMATNSVNNLEYDWQATNGGNITSASDQSVIEVNMPGTYLVVLTNPENGCTSEMPFEVFQNIEEPALNAGPNTTLNCGVNSLTLNGSLSSNETDIDIIWTSDDGTIISGEDTFNPEISTAGTYTLTIVNNENGCSNESQVTIEPNMDLPIIEFETTADFTCSTNSIILDASTSTNGPGINYSWTSASGANIFDANTANPEIFEPGEYILTISNSNNNCESTNSVIVSADTLSPSVVVAAAENLSCTINEIDLAISSDISNLNIAWIALTGNILNGENTATPRVDQAGDYQVVVTSTENGCTASAIVEVRLDDNTPTVAIEIPEELNCNQTQITLDAGLSSQGTNLSILWENENGNFVSGEDGLNPIVDMPGMYTLTIIDNLNGCEVSQSVTVSENMVLPEVSIDPPSMLNCRDLVTTIQAVNIGNSNYEYTWLTTDGNIVNGANSLNPELDADGTYQLTAIDTQNGCSATFEISVLRDVDQPEIVLGNNRNLTCTEPTALVSGIGSSEGPEFIYSWTDASGNQVANTLETTFDIEGNYTLEILNSENGCSKTALLAVADLQEIPEVIVASPETINCNSPSISLAAQATNNSNLEYTWMDANGVILNTNSSDANIDVNIAGPYTVFISNPLNGCDTTINLVVDENLNEPMVEVNADNAGEITCENPTVTLTGTLNGLNEDDVDFVWQTNDGNIISGENTLNPIVNTQGIYQLLVTDLSNGCSNMNEFNITQDDAIPLSTLNQPEELNCIVSTTTLSIPVNTGNVEIVWTLDGTIIPNANNSELVVDSPGEYSVLISNLDNGCNSMDIVAVTQDIESPIVNAGADFELQCNIPEFQIEGSSSGNPNFTISWDVGTGNISQGATSLNPTVNSPGTYTLTATNENNGCMSTDEVIISINNDLPFDVLTESQDPLCIGDVGSFSVQEVLGGEGPFTYSIDGGDTFSEVDNFESLEPGLYEIAILDANECPFLFDFEIESPEAIGVNLPVEVEVLLGDSTNFEAILSNIDINDIQSIQWTPSSGLSCDDCLNPTVLSNIDINYELEVILSSGCSANAAVQLRIDRNLDVYVPDAFSPYNGDGINDEFFLFARERAVTNISSFAIYDRWGNQVFLQENIQPNDPSVGWRGEFREERFNPGVFIYVIEVEFRTGNTEILKGNVTVME